ncbi:winged helix-turn-helix transcriptional regulator [Nonomuraea sp. MG754425]|uniref:GntR family transcriptional regulator n=1 Tax=Nonomuraea sp. MG754425 TaxID=2570319 RepID=UPI001F3F1E5D|nr:winged helix-turn-helix domain-containing protein [Nonomuraea sp. MG754425]MCF6470721.1 winged helix-turn-helix transcriptional regulator [Nonomuraea sp. MG754425]
MIDFEPDRPRWQQIADVLRSRITAGEYPPKYLVSEVRLVQEFGVARDTIRKAIRQLREEGLIYTVPNLGSFVSPPANTEPAGS